MQLLRPHLIGAYLTTLSTARHSSGPVPVQVSAFRDAQISLWRERWDFSIRDALLLKAD